MNEQTTEKSIEKIAEAYGCMVAAMTKELKKEIISKKTERITDRVREIFRHVILNEFLDEHIPYSESGEMHASKIWFDPSAKKGSSEVWATARNYDYFADSGYILLADFEYPNSDGWINSDMGYEGRWDENGNWEPTEYGLEAARNDMFEQCWEFAAPEENIEKAIKKWVEIHDKD